MEDRVALSVRIGMDAALACMRHMASDQALQAQIADAVAVCVATLRNGGRILFAGNGGSAADAQHLASELVGRFHRQRPALAAIALTTDTSILTAVGNDYGYDVVFARQVEALAREGDVLVALSTSGRSPSILRALDTARSRGVHAIGFTGASGGEMPGRCGICIRVPSTETPRIQEGHAVIGHLLCALIEQEMFPA